MVGGPLSRREFLAATVAAALAAACSDGDEAADLAATSEPTATRAPTATAVPTATPEPTAAPDPTPTPEPTAQPSPEPTAKPTVEPTLRPTIHPTIEPTAAPTHVGNEACPNSEDVVEMGAACFRPCPVGLVKHLIDNTCTCNGENCTPCVCADQSQAGSNDSDSGNYQSPLNGYSVVDGGARLESQLALAVSVVVAFFF